MTTRPSACRPPYTTRAALADVTTASQRASLRAQLEQLKRYDAYITSRAWKENPARLAELEAAGRRCRVCDRGPPKVSLEVHHRHYRNFGCEKTEDLTTLCTTCHRCVTLMLKKRKSYGWV